MMRLAVILGLAAAPALAGDAGGDLTAPVPLCTEIDAALAQEPADFAGLHPDAFAQFRAMLADLCRPRPALPDDVLLARVFNGHRVPPAQVPAPGPGGLLAAALAALAVVKAVRA
jgi:hypothetical protein